MRIHCLQHVPFEGPANIAVWAKRRGHNLSQTMLFDGQRLPDPSDIELLIILGGPMNVYEESKYPWLTEEKRFLERAIAGGKTVLGICLGAQLIADVLGGAVYQNDQREIGWHPVTLTPEASSSDFFCTLPDRFTAFHWHGDTFCLPSGCLRTAESEACANQAFEYDGRVVGLQFHLESSLESISLLIHNCAGDLIRSRYVQSAEDMLSSEGNLQEMNGAMVLLLDGIERAVETSSRSRHRET